MSNSKPTKGSWADEVEAEEKLTLPSVVYGPGVKTVTEFKVNDKNQMVKIIRTFKLERTVMSKSVAQRRAWKKFGDSAEDPAGPNPATTTVGETVLMKLFNNNESDFQLEDDAMNKLKELKDRKVRCRTCNGEHWTARCPNKYMLNADKSGQEPAPPPAKEPAAGRYVPPKRKGGSTKREEFKANIKIDNLSVDATQDDLKDLVASFGQILKVHIPKHRRTNEPMGFGFVNFKYRKDAARAIKGLNGHGYDHLILSVAWAK
ncbi:eukaryotic translation initiation factor 3 subunit G-B-like [Aethina tumida]|uniref:eukaryotic translation initiation factor 3 subunit G-B-like n=1 Tax=Aethina tumida TaxID=116153 RepID=UPI00096AED3F|nr:eukaryotic translation initiation factor 3 subunit G-B-like [Aethina tumida]